MSTEPSYSHSDSSFAQRLDDQLRSWGYDTWIDIKNIPPGAYWPEEIDKGLAAADIIIAVFSPNSMVSRNAQNEWDWALENEKPLIPILWQKCKIRQRYIALNYCDFADDERAGFVLLKSALQDAPKLYQDNAKDIEASVKRNVEGDRIDNRGRLLRKVYDYWIKGVLTKAQAGGMLLDLEVGLLSETVQASLTHDIRQPEFAARNLESTASIFEILQYSKNKLLILGKPGYGKTVTLLNLADELIERAIEDPDAPVPVVLNLASWAEKRLTFRIWLVEQLRLEYQVPKKLGQRWVESGRLFFLLDGLDEVPILHRDGCVSAINAFWQDYEWIDSGIVICSRIDDYDRLSERLHFENAIVLKPLKYENVDSYLGKLGNDWAGLRVALSQDQTLRDLAESPLLLNIMTVALKTIPSEQITGLSDEDQQRELFDRYVARCLHWEEEHEPYTRSETFRFLAWLGRMMIGQGQAVFQLESISFSWVDNSEKQWHAALLEQAIIIGTSAIVSVAIFWLFHGLVWGLTAGLVIVVFFLLGILLAKLGLELPEDLALGKEEGTGLLVDELDWSWKEVRSGIIPGLVIGTIFGFFSGLLGGVNVGLYFGLFTWLFWIVSNGISGSDIEMRIKPNQGIWRSAKNAVIVLTFGGMIFGLAGGLGEKLVGGLVFGPVWRFVFGAGSVPSGELFVGAVIGLGVGLLGALEFGGAAVIQHISIRYVLWRSGELPLNYAKFLDYVAYRNLMRKVGGGYIFRHRRLMEYFAKEIDSK